MTPVRVLIADDHALVRDGLQYVLGRTGGEMTLVGAARDGRELLELAATAAADVYVVDVTMPIVNGIEATRELLRRDPKAKVIVVSLHDAEAVVGEALRAGASGYLTKTTASQYVVEAIREVYAGRCYLSPEVAGHVVKGFVGPATGGETPAERLTGQERRVLQLIAEGHSTKEIASLLGRSPNTVHKHRSNLMAKLDLHDQVALTRYALREGLARP